MSTKCVVIDGPEPKKGKEVELCFALEGALDAVFEPTCESSKDFSKLELLCFDYRKEGYDLIFAIPKEDRGDGTLFLGYWNDGVVHDRELPKKK